MCVTNKFEMILSVIFVLIAIQLVDCKQSWNKFEMEPECAGLNDLLENTKVLQSCLH